MSAAIPQEQQGKAEDLEGRSYSQLVWLQFKRNRLALAALASIGLLALVALGADLLAGNKPYYMVYKDKTYFPALRQYPIVRAILTCARNTRRPARPIGWGPTAWAVTCFPDWFMARVMP